MSLNGNGKGKTNTIISFLMNRIIFRSLPLFVPLSNGYAVFFWAHKQNATEIMLSSSRWCGFLMIHTRTHLHPYIHTHKSIVCSSPTELISCYHRGKLFFSLKQKQQRHNNTEWAKKITSEHFLSTLTIFFFIYFTKTINFFSLITSTTTTKKYFSMHW